MEGLSELTVNVLQLKEVGGYYRNVPAVCDFFTYHKSFFEAQCRQFLLGAVMGWLSLYCITIFLFSMVLFCGSINCTK
jgi:hypothetical protein